MKRNPDLRAAFVWGGMSLIAGLLGCKSASTPRYRPNASIRASVATLEPHEVIEADIDGCPVDRPDDLREIILALRRSEERTIDANGNPYARPSLGRGGGLTLSFRVKVRSAGDVPAVNFMPTDPAAHQGPAFARVIGPVLERSECLRKQAAYGMPNR